MQSEGCSVLSPLPAARVLSSPPSSRYLLSGGFPALTLPFVHPSRSSETLGTGLMYSLLLRAGLRGAQELSWEEGGGSRDPGNNEGAWRVCTISLTRSLASSFPRVVFSLHNKDSFVFFSVFKFAGDSLSVWKLKFYL